MKLGPILALLTAGFFSLSASADGLLTLHVFRSPYGLNWESPRSLARTVIRNTLSFKNRQIGHVAIEVSCDSGERFLTGVSNLAPDPYPNLILKEKIGIGVIFSENPGRLENPQEVKKEIAKKQISKGNKRINFISFKVSDDTCQRLADYHREFVERGVWQRYGLPHEPLKGEGAGCSAYAASFLYVGGLMLPSFLESWRYQLRVPLKFIGGEYNPVDTRHEVSLAKLFFLNKKENAWAQEGEPHRSIEFWDPDTMFNWINSVLKRTSRGETTGFEVTSQNRTFGLLYDATNVPTPTGPIWQD